MKHALIACMLVGLGFGQSSHRGLTTELLKNLYGAISDSLTLPEESLDARFADASNLESYLNALLPENQNPSDGDQVSISVKNFVLSINRNTTKTVRNPGYLRQLELKVVFSYEQTEFAWQGKISDNLSKAQLKTLLEEETPFEVRGDYATDEPPVLLIALTTAGVFAIGAALFFIRT